jgi:hypothetical protein
VTHSQLIKHVSRRYVAETPFVMVVRSAIEMSLRAYEGMVKLRKSSLLNGSQLLAEGR